MRFKPHTVPQGAVNPSLLTNLPLYVRFYNHLHISVLEEAIPKSLFITTWTVFLCAINTWVHPFPDYFVDAPYLSAVSTVLSFLLIFRTNSAYDRFYEGRRLWTTIITVSTNIARITVNHLHAPIAKNSKELLNQSPELEKFKMEKMESYIAAQRKIGLKLIILFANCVLSKLRKEWRKPSPIELEILKQKLLQLMDVEMKDNQYRNFGKSKLGNNVLSKFEQKIRDARSAKHRSNQKSDVKGFNSEKDIVDEYELLVESQDLKSITMNTDNNPDFKQKLVSIDLDHLEFVPFDSSESKTCCPLIVLDELSRWTFHHGHVINTVDRYITNYIDVILLTSLNDAYHGCLRIARTPLPSSYLIHLEHIMAFFFLMFPFPMIPIVNWYSVLLAFATNFVFIGIYYIGKELEDPFGTDYNDLPMEKFVKEISNELKLMQSNSLGNVLFVPKPKECSTPTIRSPKAHRIPRNDSTRSSVREEK